jgi:xanthine dehydrogenase accessory factor
MLAVATSLVGGARSIIEPGSAIRDELRSRIAAGESGIVALDGEELFLQVHTPPVRLIVVGATHIAQVLIDLAQRIGYEAVVVDPRAAFATAARLGGTRALIDRPETSLPILGLDARTAVVAVTHAAHLDDEALIAALRSDCLYIGALGSTRTHAGRLERLRAAGFSEAELARIHAPIGLSIGAKGPAEIALSILAEIVQVARAKQ